MSNKWSFLRTWLGLTLAGGLGYTFLRALATMIALGTPWYDWLWYVPLSAFLIGLALQAAWSWPPPRRLRWVYVALLGWIIGGCSPPGLQEHLALAGTPPVTISFWAYTDFRQMPEPVLADLRASHALLYLHAPTQTFDGDSGQNLASGLRRLAAQNIPVVLMPPASDFLSTPVRREWIARAQLAAAFLRRDHILNVRGLIGDAEIPMHAPLDLVGAHAADVEAATQELRDLIDILHHDYPGLQVGITALWPFYLDGFDRDSDLAVVGRSPVDPPGGWDFVNVMTYSSYWPSKQQPYWVLSIVRGMARRYPQAQSSHLIGLVGGGMPGEPLLSFDELVRDARICRALGVREIVVFQLNGALQAFGEDFVRRFHSAVNTPDPPATIAVPFARLVSLAHYGLAAGDAVLDVRGPHGWVAIVWLLLSAGVAARALVKNPRIARIGANL